MAITTATNSNSRFKEYLHTSFVLSDLNIIIGTV
jgi:hypothetical protein